MKEIEMKIKKVGFGMACCESIDNHKTSSLYSFCSVKYYYSFYFYTIKLSVLFPEGSGNKKMVQIIFKFIYKII